MKDPKELFAYIRGGARLLSSDFSGLRKKTVLDFVSIDDIRAINARLSEKGRSGEIDDYPVFFTRIWAGEAEDLGFYRRECLDNPLYNSSELGAVATIFGDSLFDRRILEQFPEMSRFNE